MIDNSKTLSIIIPLFNEANRLEKSLALLARHIELLGDEVEVLLINDGSTDKTEAICQNIVNRHASFRLLHSPLNRGKGFAVRLGVLNALGKYIIYMDADLAVPLVYVRICYDRLHQGAPIVIASRHLPDSVLRVRESFFRQLFGEVFRRFAKLTLNLKVSDVTCGLKGFQATVALHLFSRSRIERWGYDAEILFLARTFGYTVEEIPVEWHHSFDSKVKVGLDSARTLLEMMQIHWYRISGAYHR